MKLALNRTGYLLNQNHPAEAPTPGVRLVGHERPVIGHKHHLYLQTLLKRECERDVLTVQRGKGRGWEERGSADVRACMLLRAISMAAPKLSRSPV